MKYNLWQLIEENILIMQLYMLPLVIIIPEEDLIDFPT